VRIKGASLHHLSAASPASGSLAQLIPPHHRPRLGLCLAATLEVLPDGPSWSVLHRLISRARRGEARWHAAGGPVVVSSRDTLYHGKGGGCEGVQVVL